MRRAGAIGLFGAVLGCAGVDDAGLASVEPVGLGVPAVASVPDVVDEHEAPPKVVELEPVGAGACAQMQPTGRGTKRLGAMVRVDAGEGGTVTAMLVGTRAVARPFDARMYVRFAVYQQGGRLTA